MRFADFLTNIWRHCTFQYKKDGRQDRKRKGGPPKGKERDRTLYLNLDAEGAVVQDDIAESRQSWECHIPCQKSWGMPLAGPTSQLRVDLAASSPPSIIAEREEAGNRQPPADWLDQLSWGRVTNGKEQSQCRGSRNCCIGAVGIMHVGSLKDKDDTLLAKDSCIFVVVIQHAFFSVT